MIVSQVRISIHALLAESDCQGQAGFAGYRNFYPRSPCGERQAYSKIIFFALYFYPRSPCGERLRKSCEGISYFIFLSTLSLRRATSPVWGLAYTSRQFLSTLSLRRATTIGPPFVRYFNGFLSTLSLRRATTYGALKHVHQTISIHALLAESDAPRARLMPG